MATLAPSSRNRPKLRLAPALAERALAVGCAGMAAALLVSVLRGLPEWHRLPPIIWFHIVTIAVALVLSPVILLGRKGDRQHRVLGYVWAGAVVATAAASFWIREINHGALSPIHVLSAFTLVQVPRIVLAARRRDISAHRRGILWMIFGALLIAGFFTLLPSRILGAWLLGT